MYPSSYASLPSHAHVDSVGCEHSLKWIERLGKFTYLQMQNI